MKQKIFKKERKKSKEGSKGKNKLIKQLLH